MQKLYKVVYYYGNPSYHGCGGGTKTVTVKAEDAKTAERKALKKTAPGEHFMYCKVVYDGPSYCSKGLNIIQLPSEKIVAKGLTKRSTVQLVKHLNNVN